MAKDLPLIYSLGPWRVQCATATIRAALAIKAAGTPWRTSGMDQEKLHDPDALDEANIAEPPHNLWSAFRKIGPGIILAGSIIGSGELLLTTALGAKYGFVFLWLILFSCVIKVFVQIELGRYSLSSGLPTLTALDALPGPRWARIGWCGGGSSCC